MTILSLNVWGGQLREPLLALLKSRAASVDVFCLQEMTSATIPVVHSQRATMTLNLAEQIQAVLPDHRLTLAPSREQSGEQLALFTRTSFPIADGGFTKIVAMGTPGILSSGGAFLQFVRLIVDSRALTIAHLHGYWEKDEGEDKPPRDEQITNIFRFIHQQPNPVVLCGDFNMNRRTQGIARLSKEVQNLIEDYSIPTTRPASNPYHGTVADYMFVSSQLTVRSFEVLHHEVSDHLPLIVDIDV